MGLDSNWGGPVMAMTSIYHVNAPPRTTIYKPPTDKQINPYFTYEEIDIMNFMIRVFGDGFPLFDKYYLISNIIQELFTDVKK